LFLTWVFSFLFNIYFSRVFAFLIAAFATWKLNRFYTFEIEVPVDQYDAVLSYFNRTFKDKLAAKNFTISLFQVADYSKRPVMDILAEIQGQDQLQLSSTLCYYLNNQRSNATLLGINALVTPNFYAARNVLP
jgi:hypothetical protein